MFYDVKIKSHVRVSPTEFNIDTKEAVLHTLNKKYENFVSKELGYVIGVLSVEEVGEGTIIAGDGAAYYQSVFRVLVYRPELQEITLGKIGDITDFGAFISIGVTDGMIHVSQTMDDFVSFSKSKVLTGKESKRNLKAGDKCRARIIAISFKESNNPKIGLTMRQPGLGALHWVDAEPKPEKPEKPEKKSEGKKK